jgi:outer membrane protein OmpA-like peptidoglycan-associated protein
MNMHARVGTTSKMIKVGASLVLLLGVLAATAAAQSALPDPSGQKPSFGGNVQPLYFPFDIHSKVVNPPALDENATWLNANGNASPIWVQGYADPRGDIVYNLVLSYRRAQFVKAQLVKRGVDASRFGYTTGWGKLYQTCEKADEKCWQVNRRADLVEPSTMMFHFAQ